MEVINNLNLIFPVMVPLAYFGMLFLKDEYHMYHN